MNRRLWCDYCQDWSDVYHYGEDGAHLHGSAYGREGELLAKEDRLEEIRRLLSEPL